MSWTRSAHPHGRGEDIWGVTGGDGRGGSPPRAWGGLRPMDQPMTGSRLTPTGVGRTRCGSGRGSTWPAHPHGRGEDATTFQAKTKVNGSPPRAWGGPFRSTGLAVSVRLTPTGVGRTFACPRGSSCSTAHPHGRGEDTMTAVTVGQPIGSPPRAWGGPGRLLPAEAGERLTPTGVGRTPAGGSRPSACTAHPHGRGEDPPPSREGGPDGGSPPRAWGGHFPTCGFTFALEVFGRPNMWSKASRTSLPLPKRRIPGAHMITNFH